MAQPTLPTVSSGLDSSPEVAKRCLRAAVKDLSERGLMVGAKWAAEMLNSVSTSRPRPRASIPPHPLRLHQTPGALGPYRTSTPSRFPAASEVRVHNHMSTMAVPSPSVPDLAMDEDHSAVDMDVSIDPIPVPPSGKLPVWASGERCQSKVDEDEEDVYMLAKTYFDAKEMERAAWALRDCKGEKAKFLRCYSNFLVGEKKAQEASGTLLGQKDRVRPPNKNMTALLAELKDTKDPFLLYLKAIVLEKWSKRTESINCLVESIGIWPYNWSAWLKLSSLIEKPEEHADVTPRLPPSFMSELFSIHATIEVNAASEDHQKNIDRLQALFPKSMHLVAQKALLLYHLRSFNEAENVFEELFEKDPYRIDHIDTFSNILYVMGRRAKLAEVAHRYTALDKDRPETCCLVGNYYSQRSEHQNAILYFRRALKLDRGYLSAWTLMGHEYVEMKNTHAAIESYRRAVEVDTKDYRAWYGLGQTYELLKMYYYALHYFQKATALKPHDQRMWAALAQCYDRLDRPEDAIRCHKRAMYVAEVPDQITLLRLASLYDHQGDREQAAAFHRRAVDVGMSEDMTAKQLAPSFLYLAKMEIRAVSETGKRTGDLHLAEQWIQKILGTNTEEEDDARNLLSELRALQLER